MHSIKLISIQQLSIIFYCIFSIIHGGNCLTSTILLNSKRQNSNFNFPDEPQPQPDGADPYAQPQSDDMSSDLLTRQLVNGTGTPVVLTPAPPVGLIPAGQVITPAIVTPTTAQTCVCAPTGSCNATTNVGSVDGSGLIDIRIVTTNPSSPVATTTGGIAPPPGSAGTICQANLVSCCSPGPYQCGVRYPPIIGSTAPGDGQAAYGEFPWQVALLGPGSVYIGSGVLLDSLNVLTVAHRAANFTAAPNTLTARFGEWNAGATNEPIPAIEYVVSRIFLHPAYSAANLKNDVAILRLSQAVPLGNSPTITTGCLPATAYTGQRCWISGWGRNDFNTGNYQSIQKKVEVPIQPTATCQSQLAATRLGARFVFDAASFICAGGELGRDACTGDGGSPLVCMTNNRWYVAGLVAWGIGCGQANIPGVYVNVQTFIPWIQSTMATP